MDKRMTEKRLAEIEGMRFTPTTSQGFAPMPARSDLTEELLQALKVERDELQLQDQANDILTKRLAEAKRAARKEN